MGDIDCYEDLTIDIHEELLDKDFDEVAFEPESIDDSDSEAAELYGYNR